MVRPRLDDGVEVYDANAELLEIRELFCDAPEVSAVKVVGRIIALKRSGLPFDGLVRAFVKLRGLTEQAVVLNAFLSGTVIGESETVGEDLIHYAAGKPPGRLKSALINRQAKALGGLGAEP